MTNKLTQAELIALVKEAGGIGLSTPQVSFSRDALAKFAQLIQQRQMESKAVAWKVGAYSFTDYAQAVKLSQANMLEIEPLYNHLPTASQLVAQALEKALGLVANELYRDGVPAFPLERFEAISHGFRALIDQPVEHIVDANKMVDINDKQPCQSSVSDKAVIKDSLTTESRKLVPLNADSRMLNAAVKFALQISLSAEYSWRQYMADLYAVFMKHAPVEQGGDELVAEALLAAKYFIINGTALGYIRMPAKEHPDPAHNTLPLIEKALSQALANRRGGE